MAVPTTIKRYFIHQIFSKNVSSTKKAGFRKKSTLRICNRGTSPSGNVRESSLNDMLGKD